MKLLTLANAKVQKGQAAGFLTAIMHLAPAWLSGYNVCPMASKGCIAACLNLSGVWGAAPATQTARIRKTKMFFENREAFMKLLIKDILALVFKAEKMGLAPAVRLNGTSDIRWENVSFDVGHLHYDNIMEMFPGVIFYDYTAISNRHHLPSNYSLTFSRKEDNDAAVVEAIIAGMNVAVVFGVKKDTPLPASWMDTPVIDGDLTDLRFLDAKFCIVGLRGKGKAKGKNRFNDFVVSV